MRLELIDRLDLEWIERPGERRLKAVDQRRRRLGDRLARGSGLRGKQRPLVGDALQSVAAAIGELQAGAGDDVFERPRDEDFTRACRGLDPGRDVHRQPRESRAAALHLTDMEAGTYV